MIIIYKFHLLLDRIRVILEKNDNDKIRKIIDEHIIYTHPYVQCTCVNKHHYFNSGCAASDERMMLSVGYFRFVWQEGFPYILLLPHTRLCGRRLNHLLPERLHYFIEKYMGQNGILCCSFVLEKSKIGQEIADLELFS